MKSGILKSEMRDIYTYFNNFEKYKSVETICIREGIVSQPDLSIFIPTYKRTDTIVDTLNSVIEQKGEYNYEIVIICNDPQIDHETIDNLLKRFNDERIYFYVNQKNIGLCGNWNRGLELCRAEYVAMIHDDDVLSPWFVQYVMQAIKDNDKPGIVGVNAIVFQSDSIPEFNPPQKTKYREISKKAFFFNRNITIAGMTVNRRFVMSLGGYSEEYLPNEDTILIYQAILKGKVINIEEYLAGYRQGGNLTLEEGVLAKIIEYTELTRRNIAEHEGFAKRFMRCFDKEYLYSYILGASEYWNIDVDINGIMNKLGFSNAKPNSLKMKILNRIISRGIK